MADETRLLFKGHDRIVGEVKKEFYVTENGGEKSVHGRNCFLEKKEEV